MILMQRNVRTFTFIFSLFFAVSIIAGAAPKASPAVKSGRSTEISRQIKKKQKKSEEADQSGQEKLPPALASDPAVSSGTLPNGMKYYIAVNSTETGLAQFALVRRTDYVTDHDSTLRQAGALLTDLKRFGGRSSRKFAAGIGAYSIPSTRISDGSVVSVRDDAVIYRFGTLPVSVRSDIVDSTLLMIFDIVESLQNGGELHPGYSTSDNAVIIAGDVDKAALLTKLQNMSLMVENVSVPGGEPRSYKWVPQDSLQCSVSLIPASRRAAFLTFSYRSPRTPDKYLPTSLKDVSDYYADVLGLILKRRFTTEMTKADIPLASVTSRYVSSADQPGDEVYEFTLCVAPEDVPQTCRVAASIIANIDSYGILRPGFADSRSEYLTRLYISSQRSVIYNDRYVDQCISSFLYGTTPATDYEKWSFVGKGDTDESTTRYFNNFASSLMSGDRNLTISLRTGDLSVVTPAELKRVFTEAYSLGGGDRISYAVNQSDTLGFKTFDDVVNQKGKDRLKIISTKTDAASGGGTRWTFSNGVSVVYKRMETQGLFYYNLLIRGGFSSATGMNKGEGAFLNDMLSMYDAGGVKGENFHTLMRSNGIVVTSEVSVSDMSIYGVASRPSLPLLMKAFTTFTSEGTINRSRFDYYRRSELLRLESDKGSRAYRTAVIDSLFSPSYRYYTDKMVSGLYDDVAVFAEKFFRDQFSRVNDGVLVIIGDMNEDLMKKFLLKYVGGFPTSDDLSQRARIDYSPISGQTTHIVSGSGLTIDVAMSIPFAYTADNYMIVKVAELAIQEALNRRLAGFGAVAKVRTDFFSYPQERAVLMVSAENIPLESLPGDEIHLGEEELLSLIRGVLRDVSVSEDDLAVYKTVLKNQFSERQKDPWYWIHMVKTRVSDVKDLNSKYSEKIGAVTSDQVAALFARLDGGSKVEFIVR